MEDRVERRRRARRGLAVYLSLVGVTSALLEVHLIRMGGKIDEHVGWVVLLMWMPALASIVTRLLLREGFSDVSFRWGGARGWRAAGLGVVYPLLVGLLAYGTAWASGLALFSPPPVKLLGLVHAAGLLRFAGLVGISLTLGLGLSLVAAAGEEIGWRGYMLTRLIDAEVPRPVLASGLIWGGWHLPLILSGHYATGPIPSLSAVLFMVDVVAAAYLLARLRLESGSVWAACVGHAAWNSIIQGAFDASTRHAGLWVGESGILTAVAALLTVAVLVRRPFPLRRHPLEKDPGLIAALRL